MAAVATMSLDEYLNRPNQGGGARFLKGWRKKGEVTSWLHTKAKFVSVYQHNFPRNDDGPRKVPAKLCPMSLLIAEVYRLIQDEELGWTDRLFAFKGDREDRIIYAGGFVGMFSGELDTDQKDQLFKDTGLRQKEAWNQAGLAKENWVFSVVDNSDVSSGCLIAVETGLLGDKMSDMIEKEMERSPEGKGNPLRHPYAIKWKYREKEREFHKKYDAVPQPMVPMTEEVEKLIRETDPPDISRVTTLPNYKELRARMEKYCVVDLDWDRIFGGVWKNLDSEGRFIQAQEKPASPPPAPPRPAESKGSDESKETLEAPSETTVESKSVGRRRKVQEKPPEPPPGDPCEECGAAMAATDVICGKCGAEYETDEPSPQPKQVPKKGGKSKGSAKPDPAPAPASSTFASDDEEDDPFADED